MDVKALAQIAAFLAAGAIAAPLASALRIGKVLGYLLAGVVLGPYVLRVFVDVDSILHVAELGVILLLFVIGLELRPQRLWALRNAVFGLGGMQVGLTSLAIFGALLAWGIGWRHALFLGLALSLSSTAFVLQILQEKGELDARHGRLAFAVLLFQDLAAIPMIAFVALLSTSGGAEDASISWTGAASGLGAIFIVVVFGRYLVSRLYRLVARTGVKEAMTASALLTVVAVVLLMNLAGLSAALGAFLAGALLADSEYRHEIEANLAPFEGLLLGLFFVAVGMSLNLSLLAAHPFEILAATAALIVVKAVIAWGLGRWQRLKPLGARRFGLALSQGGEFAFVLAAAAMAEGVLDRGTVDFMTVVVTLSMGATPLLLLADEVLFPKPTEPEKLYDELPKEDGHVIIAGLGRVGQIVSRILAARHIPFTALDANPEQVEVVRRFGNRVYFGDASRLDILEAAGTDKARAFVLAIDDVEASLRTAELVRRHYPGLPVFARARNRQHAHRLMDMGITLLHRETFLSSVEISRDVLRGLGVAEPEVRRITSAFIESDRRRLYEDYAHFTDQERMRANALKHADELEELLRQDVEERERQQREEIDG